MNNNMPIIRGLNECSEFGPDLYAPAIFVNSCNLRCPYCMNSKLALGQCDNHVSIEDVKKAVENSESKWLMISGGEPTYTPTDLMMNLLKEIKKWNCKIGMSTNGTLKDNLRPLLPMLNYVAMDLKSISHEDYLSMGDDKMGSGLFSVLTVKAMLTEEKMHRDDFDYEIRTTLYPPFINAKSVAEMGEIMRRDERWVFQHYRKTKNMIHPSAYKVDPYNDEEVTKILEIAKKFVDNVLIRYV